MKKHKVVAFMPAPEEFVLRLLSYANDPAIFDLTVSRPPYDEDEICRVVEDQEIILSWVGGPYLSRRILESAGKVRFIQFASVGYAKIDLQAATELGIPVANNPGWNSISVAEHTLMSILVVLKKAFYAYRGVLEGKWVTRELVFNEQIGELHGKTLGILGLGSIGRQVAELARPYEVRILYHKRNRLSAEDEEALGVEYCSFDELLESSDVLTVHVPLSEETRGMIGADEIAKMKDGAILVNTARAGIVDEGALAEALRAGKLSGAAIDVPREPDEQTVFSNVFSGLDNVLLTPHIAGQSREGSLRGRAQASENLGRYLDGMRPNFLVNDVWR